MSIIINNINSLISSSLNAKNNLVYKSVDDLEELLATDYSEAYEATEKGYIIYRGSIDIPYGNPSYAYTAIPKTRVSKESISGLKLNYYTLLFSDILPSWEYYPKRNRSFICTCSSTIAMNYTNHDKNNVSIVLPKNGAKIGICNSGDIWYSFAPGIKQINEKTQYSVAYPKRITCLDDFNNGLYELFRLFKINNANNAKSLVDALYRLENSMKTCDLQLVGKDNSIELTINGNRKILNNAQTNYTNNYLTYYLYQQCIDGKHFIDVLNNIFSPQHNYLDTKYISSYDILADEYSNEVWTDSECLFIQKERAKTCKVFSSLNY